MKTLLLKKILNRSIYSVVILLLILFASYTASAQNRDGSIDLTGAEGRYIYLNDDGSNKTLGVEGEAFTLEAWVYLVDNNNDNFNFFRFRSGDSRVSLRYNSDANKGSDAWRVDVKGTGYGEKHWDLPYNKNGNTGPNFMNNWRHIAFVSNGGSTVKLYVDGVEKFGYNLTTGGSALSNLWPSDKGKDGNSVVGFESVTGNNEGKMYISEVRLWNTQLTSGEIAKYYDEEVNSSHPEWNNLIRYYHGNYSTGSGSSRKYTDVKGNYNAGVSNSDVTINTSFTPPIKPADFDYSSISSNFNATTCNTQERITVGWLDFRNYSSYASGTEPYYELRRVRDNKLIHSGTSNVINDEDVSYGDSESYQLKTYWLIGGAAQYSDAVIYSNTGTVSEQFGAPSGFEATTNNCNGEIDLSWDAMSPAPPKWTIQRANNSSFNSGVTTLTSSLAGTITNFTDESPNTERTYYYRIKASGNDDNGCSVLSTNSVVESGVTYEPPTAPTNLTVVVDEDEGEFDISWTNPSNSYADGFILTREKEDGSDKVEFVFNNTSTTSYSDAAIEICQTYRYRIAATNECSPDGVVSNVTQTALLGQDIDDVMETLSASKGYFGDAVRLEWEINGGLSQVDRFMIERTVAGEDNYQFIGSVTDNLIFDDETAVAGTFYNYAVYGQSTCNDEISSTNILTALGFRQPFGIANGHIEYSGGNAVENVTVNFERQDGLSIGQSLKFDGDGDYVAIDTFHYVGTDYSKLTVETWFKTTTTEHDIIASADASEYWRFYISGGNVGMVVQGGSNVASIEDYNDGEWHHAAAVFDGDSLKLYVDGALNNKVAAATPVFGTGSVRYLYLGLGSEAADFNAGKGPYDYYEGNLDEFRIWSVARTDDEIARNYNRLMSNEQVGLEVYYRMDEGTGSKIYDTSKEGEIFNKHDGTFGGGVSFSNEIPSADKLGIKAITDSFGDYTADYIPYNGSGDVFRVTPSFGQHQFEPATKSIYLGDGAAVQNDLNFTDISSFTVTGTVTYENSEVPVEGVAIYIDGIQAVNSNNQAVRTDSEGKYEIDVPIGHHYLSAYKEKHTFSEGVFPPLNEFGDIELHEFTEDLTVNFTDDTKIRVAGRVVGGNVQADLPLGFDRSLNNVGVATVELQLQLDAYDIDLTNDAIYNTISVTTDEYSGEYYIDVIPEKWIINEAGNQTYFIDPSDISVMDFSNSLDTLISTDTTYNFDGRYEVAEFHYNHDMSFIIQTDPIIEVLDGNDELFHGEDSITFLDQETEAEVTIQLGDSNPFAYDVFKMGVDYDVNVYVYQIYSNPNHPDGSLIDKVPVKDAEVIINDNLMINPEPTQGMTNENGLFQYEFRAGMPNLSGDGENTYTKTFEVEASVGGLGITWNQGDIYRAYVLGAKPELGTDFITYGPDQIDVVLRDPPGSNSYAWIEEGSAYSTAQNWQFETKTDQGQDLEWYTGFLVQAGGGLAGPVVKNETVSHSEIGLEVERYIDYNGTYGKRITFTERIETSSDPEDVGSMADLYIGRSFNAFVQETRNLKVMPRAYCVDNDLPYYGEGEYVLGVISGFTMDEGDTETYFVYSQRHILQELIPDLILLRNELMISDKYESKLDVSHECWGMSNDNTRCLTKYFTEAQIEFENQSYNYVGPADEMDSVDFINDNITVWMNAIAMNEAEKAEAITQTNISIDGSTGAYTSTLKEDFTGEYNWNSSRALNFKWNGNFTNLTNNAGLGVETTMGIDLNFANGKEHTQERSVEFGYVIDERDEGDYYSIDVKKQDGVAVFDASDFVDNIPSKDRFINEQLIKNGIAVGAAGGIFFANKYGTAKAGTWIADKLGKSANANVWAASAQFTVNLGVWLFEMVNIGINVTEIIDRANGVRTKKLAGFSIGSPIFSVRGGQTRCPYEPAEFSTFYVDDSQNYVQLHTATLQREVPSITSAPTIQSNVPDSEVATFTLSLGNESESDSDVWYELSIDESTNPDGAVILVDGVSAEREFLVPANQIVTKTLTVAPGTNGTLDYENLGIVLHSSCQADPTSSVNVLADTVFITAKFLPTCTNVEIANMNDNWIINHADGDFVPVTLGGYDINATTLESVSFQYKTLSGNPITVMTYFKDVNSDAYINYDGAKDELPGGDVSFSWDISSLTDGDYQLIAKTTCIDGSVTESEILTGIIDRVTPVVFGTAEPTDGLYDAGDDIKVKFNEELASGLVRDNNISLMSILNGADVSHATAVEFDGSEDHLAIDFISMNSKSFTIEFWMQNEFELAESKETIISHGSGNSLVEIARFGTNINFTLGQTAFLVDPSPAFTSVNPWDSWHHWAFIYNQDSQSMTVYVDDQVLGSLTNVAFDPAFSGTLKIADNSNYQGRMHELRIWEDVRSFGEVIANMSVTLSGNEPGLYGYWPMDEGTGNLAVDRTSGRNATINADWSLEPGGYSWEFDGSNHLAFDGRNIVIDEETDMTLEFWFKMQATGDTVTLFSNGKGDGTDVYGDLESMMAVIADENGIINILSNGYAFQGTNTSYADNNWHHFALVVDRRTNARVYIDGALENQELATNIAGLSGADMYLGARGTALDPVNNSFDKYLSGHIDEFRVWNTARSATLIASYKHSKVAGDEPGLVAYIAFETYEEVQGAYIMQSSLEDLATDADLTDVNDAVSSDGVEYYSDQKPAVRDIRGLQNIPFDYVVNDDEIIIIPNVDLNRIEGQILEISVKNVQDLNGNRQLSPVTWTAFVQQNQVKWNDDQLEIEKHVNDAMSFTASFTNESGTAYDFELENIPVWLKADITSGVANPQETITITFEVNKAANIGTYENGINLTTESGFNEKLTVSLRVYGNEPDWSLNTNDYQYSMAVFGRLIIEGEISTDPYDKVAAFVGDELRGVANLEYVTEIDAYEAFLTIYSNVTSGETITLKAYDASTGRIHENVSPSLAFMTNDVQGSILNPQDLVASDEISMEYHFEEGWNWISFNLNDPDMAVVNDLFEGIGSDGDIVKNQSQFDIYDGASGWFGTITLNPSNPSEGGFKHGDMYKLHLTEAASITLVGSPVTVVGNTIDLKSGWNHVGFLPQFKMTLEDALVSMNPQDGDLIKTEDYFAMYSSSVGWVGSLSQMEPGKGYMMYSGADAMLEFPIKGSLVSRAARNANEKDLSNYPELSPGKEGHNMSVIATPADWSGLVLSEEVLVVAFAGDQVRGIAEKTLVDTQEFYFLSVSANTDEEISFKVLDLESGVYHPLVETLSYEADDVRGTLNDPFTLSVEMEESGLAPFIVSPNPFGESLVINMSVKNAGNVDVRLIDLNGKEILRKQQFAEDRGNIEIQLTDEVRGLKSGLYLLVIEADGALQRAKVKKD